ncbi:MAG TPA: prepilin peptidase, partial [Candidatus Paceibacterota bacterium]|nr:prepilin peptidase [Candidatus Paceibacterota bacterium]
VATASYIDAAFSFVVIFLLVSIAVYDFKHFIIPDGMVYAYLVVSFLWGSAAGGFALAGIGMTLVSGVVVAFPLFFLWAVSKGRWMGFGDVKLAAGLGMMLGILGGGSALIFAVWLGALVSLAIIAYGHVRTRMRMRFATRKARFTMKSEIPFGPFLVAGTLFVFLTDITLTRLIELL